MDEKEALDKGLLSYIGEDVDKEYIKNVKSLVIRKDLVKEKASDLKIIYTPIHGSGNKSVRRVLHELEFINVKVIKEKENPDVIFGTYPNCDRIGVIIKDNSGDYKVLTGNQTGMILADYMLKFLKDEWRRLSSKGAIIKTIVTTEGVKNIVEYYGVDLINTLTGFEYIGENRRV